ncbi:DUF1295 domain-containing protein [Burkholderia alba]|uniref:DUF1295 domain-containing protein n=1 Tax=Burkholderia alba TaxID=2683677 RepID=UPI002B05DE0B|nr:DUF1295 domain-containing protein [Burkholderia alba]
MPVAATVALAYAGTVAAFTAVWLRQLKTANAGMIDPVWAAMLGVVALLAAALGPGAAANRAFVGIAGGAWGLRLAAHLWQRNRGRPEDARYRQLRAQWSAGRMFAFFQLQAVISMLLSVAFFVPAGQAAPASAVRLAGAAAVWLAAVAGETLSDRALRRFAADPANRGEVCRAGPWRYSRHPNYFFECLHWIAYPVLALGGPWGWLTLAPPLLMAWLLLKISGIPPLEAHLAATRPGYRDYMRTTSVLVPWPPKRPAAPTR